jgi:two-component system sensor histidine kinase KdpD
VARAARGLIVALVVSAICTVGIAFLNRWIPAQGAGVVYLAGVLLVSSRYGLLPGIAASVMSMLAFNFFFLPPRHTFVIRASSDWLTLVLFLLVALVTSQLAARARDATARAEQRAREAELGLELTRAVVLGQDVASVAPTLAREAAHVLGASEGVLHLGDDDVRSASSIPVVLDRERIAGLELTTPPDEVDPVVAERVASQLAGIIALGMQRDELIAERVEAEALRRSDEVKTALLRAVSHDLRSPLMAISTAAGTLRLTATDPDERELTDTVLAAADRMNRLVSDLLDLSRLQAGAFPHSEDWCDVGDLVQSAVRDATRGTSARVRAETPGTLPLVRGDARQLERVLVNLIENAAKFSPAASPVEVEARASGDRVEVSVLDRGPGIPPAEGDRIFEPFYRGASGAGVPGSGLGLAIVRGLAEANGAAIRVERRPGGGTTFTLSLPTGVAA